MPRINRSSFHTRFTQAITKLIVNIVTIQLRAVNPPEYRQWIYVWIATWLSEKDLIPANLKLPRLLMQSRIRSLSSGFVCVTYLIMSFLVMHSMSVLPNSTVKNVMVRLKRWISCGSIRICRWAGVWIVIEKRMSSLKRTATMNPMRKYTRKWRQAIWKRLKQQISVQTNVCAVTIKNRQICLTFS